MVNPTSRGKNRCVEVEARRSEVDGLEVFWREAPARRSAPVLYLHGVPTSSDDWIPFLERTGGIAPDLPGFGRSAKPAEFDYSIAGYERFLDSFLRELDVDRYSLVVHDWGAVGLGLAQAAPERLERLVIVNSVPLLPGYRWHRVARLWRTPLVGELTMGFTTKWGFKRGARPAFERPVPEGFVDALWDHFDHGTQRAILKLYRSAPSEVLATAGAGLGAITARAMVVWGVEEPYLPTRFAEDYAEALGGPVRLELVEGAGHWPWLDRPEVVDTVVDFLAPQPQ
jgi:pimeloyl-ACP methyl ester carboxylesterase